MAFPFCSGLAHSFYVSLFSHSLFAYLPSRPPTGVEPSMGGLLHIEWITLIHTLSISPGRTKTIIEGAFYYLLSQQPTPDAVPGQHPRTSLV